VLFAMQCSKSVLPLPPDQPLASTADGSKRRFPHRSWVEIA
jgi:hypothetical protein